MNSLAGRLLVAFTVVIVLTALLTVVIASQTAALEIRHAADGMTGSHTGMEMRIENGVHFMTLPVEAVVAGVTRAVGLASLAGGVAAFGLAALVVRAVSQPLSRLALASHRVATGDLGARAPLAGPAEVVQVAQAFNQMADALSDQEHLRRTLLGDVAHELRTPLTVMQGQVEAMMDGIFPLTAEGLAPLHHQTRHLARLVDDVQLLARADAGPLALERGSVVLDPLVTEVFLAFAVEAAAQSVTLEKHVPASLPPLDADARRLRQVLDNLLSNALRHTPPGGTVRVDAVLESSAVTIHVTDTGEGIPADDVPFVFDRFYRVDRSRARASGGSGLGLAIVKRLTEHHGGCVTVDSTPGAGSRFTLTWPIILTGTGPLQGRPSSRS